MVCKMYDITLVNVIEFMNKGIKMQHELGLYISEVVLYQTCKDRLTKPLLWIDQITFE